MGTSTGIPWYPEPFPAKSMLVSGVAANSCTGRQVWVRPRQGTGSRSLFSFFLFYSLCSLCSLTPVRSISQVWVIYAPRGSKHPIPPLRPQLLAAPPLYYSPACFRWHGILLNMDHITGRSTSDEVRKATGFTHYQWKSFLVCLPHTFYQSKTQLAVANYRGWGWYPIW